jgi:hypothetical protein
MTDITITVEGRPLELLTEIKQLTANAEQLKRRADLLKAELVGFVGDASCFVSPDGLKIATYRQAKDSMTLDTAKFKAEMPYAYESYCTKVRAGGRRLLFDKFWGGE